MLKSVLAELVTVDTEDGISLRGMVIRPTKARPLPIVWIHGHTGSFYEDTVMRLGPEFAARGFTFIAGNNRGNNIVVALHPTRPQPPDAPPLLGGATFEKFSGSEYDVAAWVDFAEGLGFPGVILMGHSYGGVKVTYYQGRRQDRRVKGMVLASAWAHIRRDLYQPEKAEMARQLVSEGRLMEPLAPEPDAPLMSAEAYHDLWQANPDVFGLGTPEPLLGKISCPIFAFYGTEESDIGDAPTLEHIKAKAKASPRVETRIFEGANHLYEGTEIAVAGAVGDWVAGLE